VVELADVPEPSIGPGQVRVRIHVGAVNFPDVLVVANTYQVSVPTPFILGS
jgi:NADPH2:quinone reductase